MKPPLRSSVVVVSRHRADLLKRCLSWLFHQDHPDFEVMVVADPASLATCADLPVKRIASDAANIAVARNLGIAASAGQVIAFIDDDAVPVPVWLSRLSAPFSDPAVVAATGWTRGPDALRWQARGQRIDASGRVTDISADGDAPLLVPADPAHPVSTIGTNCAFRADALRDIGGFDPAFAYYLDESDVNMRMARAWPGRLTAIVPRAQVIHAMAPNAARARGVPDLRQIGRSYAIFAGRHGGDLDAAVESQRARIERAVLAGRVKSADLAQIMASLQAGIDEGQALAPAPLTMLAPGTSGFLPFRRQPGPTSRFLPLWGWWWQAARLRKRAAAHVENGGLTWVLLLSPDIRRHRARLTTEGWLEQSGGLWGASAPEDSRINPATGPAMRARRELRRVAWMRPPQ